MPPTPLAAPLAALVLTAVAAAQSFTDPAPPTVFDLAPVDPPAPSAYPGLTSVASPSSLRADAITSDWPGFLGPNHDGHSIETRLRTDFEATPPTLLWTMARGQGYACPVVADDRLVYTHRVDDETHVDCLDPETGRRFWRRSFPCTYRGQYISDGGPRSTPVIDDGFVYVHGVQGRLHCFELATGRTRWSRHVSKEWGIGDQFFGVVASPIVHGNLLIQNIGAPGGPCVAAFDKRTGRLVWGAGREWGPSCASPVIANVHGHPRLFVLGGGKTRPPTGGLMVMDPDDGSVSFTYPFRSRTYESATGATPVVGDGRVFISSSYSVGTAAIDLAPDGSGTPAWKVRSPGLQFSSPVYAKGYLWAIDGRSDRAGAIVCLDPATGAEVSRTDLDWTETLVYRGVERDLSMSIGEGSLLFVDGRGLCLGDNGHLLWLDLDPKGVRVLARASLFRANESWTPPVLSRGLLYVAQNRPERFGVTPKAPRLLCFDLRHAASAP